MMRFAVLCVAAASLLRGREQLEAQVARSAVMLLQEAMAAEPEKTASKATPAKEEPKATPAKEEVASQKDHEKLKANMSDADKKMWDHFDDWNHRMNQKTKVGSLDVISKIKHAVHFIKKGAMSGDEDA